MLVEGKNCWRIARASRAAYLIDADVYFTAFRRAVARARNRVVIVGWDIDSRTRLARPSENPGVPPEALTLLAFLNEALARRPELRVYALGWDFSVIYSFERELLPAFRFAWNAHPGLSFQLDGRFPLSGSHHQKIVSVDGRVAFAGGLDLAIRRWDTPAHLADDPERVDPAGRPYPPMHDVQMMVDGEAAAALDALVRARWQRATGQPLPERVPEGEDDPWPEGVIPDARDIPIGIARTMPEFEDEPAITEVSNLTIDAIAAARRWIYLEHQYLTSAVAAEAIARRLSEPDGPEIVAVLPREEHGWLEKSSMGIMRAAVLRRLTEANRHGRLRLFHPTVPGLGAACMNVHSKVMVVDDAIARVGSANLSNRSMGVDSECDLVVDADIEPRAAETIASLRDRLLAEHLGVTTEVFAGTLRARGSLIGAIESLRGGDRSLEPLPPPAPVGDAPLDLTFLDGLVSDPERPAPEKLLETFVPHGLRPPVRRSLAGWLLLVAVVLAAAAAWRLTPVSRLLDVERAAAFGRNLAAHPAAPLLVPAGYVAGGLVLFPITVLLGATALVFSPPASIVYCFVGALASAAVTFGIGRLARRWRARWLNGPRIKRISAQLQRRGMLAIAAARLLPIGNFSLINMAAGAFGVRFLDFVLGNVVGLLPGVLALTLLADRLGDTLRRPNPRNIVLLLAILLGFFTVMAWLRRRLARRAS